MLVFVDTAFRIFPWAAGITRPEDLSKALAPYGLEFHFTDKRQYILGIRIRELSDVWDEFVLVDDAVMAPLIATV